jgi:ribosomal protein S15P/S13E
MFEIIGTIISSFIKPKISKIHTGAYIFTQNQHGESVIIYDPYKQVETGIEDEMSILLLKCERLISHFKSKMNSHASRRARVLNNQIAKLVDDVIHDYENGITDNINEYHERYSHIRGSVTMTSMSSVNLNRT